MKCNKDCFRCPFPDCINDEYGPEELAMVIAFEQFGGVYSDEDAKAFADELFAACRIKREKEKERRSAAVRKAKRRKYVDGHKPYIAPSVFERIFYTREGKGKGKCLKK